MKDHLTEARHEGALEFRARCARIFRSEAAQGRLAQVKVLALDTDMTVAEAISVLSSSPLDAETAAPGMGVTDAQAAAAWAEALRRVCQGVRSQKARGPSENGSEPPAPDA